MDPPYILKATGPRASEKHRQAISMVFFPFPDSRVPSFRAKVTPSFCSVEKAFSLHSRDTTVSGDCVISFFYLPPVFFFD